MSSSSFSSKSTQSPLFYRINTKLLPSLSHLLGELGGDKYRCNFEIAMGVECMKPTYGFGSHKCILHTDRGIAYDSLDPRNQLRCLHDFFRYCQMTNQKIEDAIRLMPQYGILMDLFQNFDILKGYSFIDSIECINNIGGIGSGSGGNGDNNGSNGFIRLMTFIKMASDIDGESHGDTVDLPIILKSTKSTKADNLFWEYCAGRTVNLMSVAIPIFALTYKCYKYIDDVRYKQMRQMCSVGFNPVQLSPPINLTEYITPLPLRDSSVLKACALPKLVCFTSQYIPGAKNIDSFLSPFLTEVDGNMQFDVATETKLGLLTQLIGILQLTYLGLALFGDNFTHYDLHLGNILLWEVPDNKYIEVVILDSTPGFTSSSSTSPSTSSTTPSSGIGGGVGKEKEQELDVEVEVEEIGEDEEEEHEGVGGGGGGGGGGGDKNEEIIHHTILKTRYLPTIIDYGHAFFDLGETTNQLNTAFTINQATVKTPQVQAACKSQIPPIYPSYYHIDSTQRNISSDLRLLHLLEVNVPTSAFINTQSNGFYKVDYVELFFDLIRNIKYTGYIGTDEVLNPPLLIPTITPTSLAPTIDRTTAVPTATPIISWGFNPLNKQIPMPAVAVAVPPKVVNVYQAAEILYKIVKSENFQVVMDHSLGIVTPPKTSSFSDTKYGTLVLDLHKVRPFRFWPATNPEEVLTDLHPFKSSHK